MTLFRKLKNFDLSKLKKPTIVIGLPGIGNVGKISVDFIIESLKPEEVGKFYVDIPPMIFASQTGIEFPAIKVYHLQQNEKDFLFIAGDYQPRDSKCFEFCTTVIDFFKEVDGKEIIVLGGAAFPDEIDNPVIYYLSSSSDLEKKYSKLATGRLNLNSASGNLGPIVGVAGVILGLAKEQNIQATTFLTEINDKEYFNIASVRAALNLVNQLTELDINTSKLNLRINTLESELKRLTEGMQKNISRNKLKGKTISNKIIDQNDRKEKSKESPEIVDEVDRAWYIG